MSVLKPALCLTAALWLGACATAEADAAPSFEAQIDRHVASVTERDMDALVATITTGEDLLLILPSGRMTPGRSDYLALHETLFADPAWRMTFRRVAVTQTRDYAHALYRVTFDADGPGAAPANASWLSLGFRLENDEWRLVHDQNTRIPEDPPA